MERMAPLLGELEVATLLKVSVSTIRRRRRLDLPPEFTRIGSRVRYQRDAIQRFIEDSTSGSKRPPDESWRREDSR
jgi:hypothetical protein